MVELQPQALSDQTEQPNTSSTTVSDRLPKEVVTCLQNARFLHLATCTDNVPHVSLMNYTYLGASERPTPASTPSLPQGPLIIMTANPRSHKTTNLSANSNVSLLVHDWVSARPPSTTTTTATGSARDRSPAGADRRPSSSLASMLMHINSAAVSSISATLNGQASLLQAGSETEKWCKLQHLENNTFGPAVGVESDGGRESYIEDEEVRVVVVQLTDGRVSDWKGGVKDWVLKGGQGVGKGNLGTANGA